MIFDHLWEDVYETISKEAPFPGLELLAEALFDAADNFANQMLNDLRQVLAAR